MWTQRQKSDLEKLALETADIWSLRLLVILGEERRGEARRRRVHFDIASGRFLIDGRVVSVKQIRKYLMMIEARTAERLGKLIDDLEAGRITIEEWKREHEGVITIAHILAAALAAGGVHASLEREDLFSRIEREVAFLRDLADAIVNGNAGSWRRIKARAKSYARAIHISFVQIEQMIRSMIGPQAECRRIRRASESCDPCIKWSYRWMPIREMPPIGSFTKENGGCEQYCRCYLEYR